MCLPVAVALPYNAASDMGVCPDPAHLLIDVLPKVGCVEDTTPKLCNCDHLPNVILVG